MPIDPDFAEPIVANSETFIEAVFSGFRKPTEQQLLLSGWVAVCLVNMIIPAFYGFLITEKDGRAGMLLGVAVVMGLGLFSYAGRVLREALFTVTYGGVVVAATQLRPFLQVTSGSIAIYVAERAGLKAGDFLDTLSGGLLATLVTAGLLMALAGMIGLVGRFAVSILRATLDQGEIGD